eukprot:2817067-Karenia_brevis.AAC.1
MAAILKLFFDPRGNDMAKTGIMLQLTDGSHVHLFLTLGDILGDEEALHSMIGCKGHAGLKPCMKCKNVYQHGNPRRIPETDTTRTS